MHHCMGGRAINGQFRANANTCHHVANLGDNRPGQQAADIIFQEGIKKTIQGHDDAEHNQNLKARAGTGQGVDSSFGGDSAEKDRPIKGGLAVSIRQPGVQRHHRRIEGKAQHDQPGVELWIADIKQVEAEVTHGLIAQQYSGQENNPANGVDEQIPVAAAQGLRPASEPDQEDRGKGHQFPEEKEAEVVAAVDNAK